MKKGIYVFKNRKGLLETVYSTHETIAKYNTSLRRRMKAGSVVFNYSFNDGKTSMTLYSEIGSIKSSLKNSLLEPFNQVKITKKHITLFSPTMPAGFQFKL